MLSRYASSSETRALESIPFFRECALQATKFYQTFYLRSHHSTQFYVACIHFSDLSLSLSVSFSNDWNHLIAFHGGFPCHRNARNALHRYFSLTSFSSSLDVGTFNRQLRRCVAAFSLHFFSSRSFSFPNTTSWNKFHVHSKTRDDRM